MYHYILLFINKVLYYIRIPFYTLKILFVILWLWLCDWGIKKASPSPSEPTVTDRREVKEGRSPTQPPRKGRSAYAHTRDKDWALLSDIFCKILANLSPLPSEGLGEAVGAFSIFTYLSVKQIVTKVFAELVTPVPPKTIAFWIKLLTFANRKWKASPTAPPDLPERGGVQIAR